MARFCCHRQKSHIEEEVFGRELRSGNVTLLPAAGSVPLQAKTAEDKVLAV